MNTGDAFATVGTRRTYVNVTNDLPCPICGETTVLAYPGLHPHYAAVVCFDGHFQGYRGLIGARMDRGGTTREPDRSRLCRGGLRCAAKDGTVTVIDVLPPSIHELTHKPYVWAGLGDWRNLPELPEEILVLWRELAKNGTKPAAGRFKDGPIPEGGRNNFLASLAGSMRRRGMSEAAINAALMAENEKRCVPPLPDADVARIAKSYARYEPGQGHQMPPVESYDEDIRRWNGKHADTAAKDEEWPEPGHISQELLPVPAFDPDVLLPEPLRGWIVDQAEGMPCPIEFIAVPTLVMAGSVIGARCGIRPKVYSHWVSIPNLWGGILGALDRRSLLPLRRPSDRWVVSSRRPERLMPRR